MLDVEGFAADFGVGEFPDSLDMTGMWWGEGVHGDGNWAGKRGGDVLERVYVVG